MNSHPIEKTAEISGGFGLEYFSNMPVSPCRFAAGEKQRGVVLFLTLIALVAMSLAAVALIRSVDTNALITGNIAFKQETITSADGGILLSMQQLQGRADANIAIHLEDDAALAHPFNNTNFVTFRGYHSNINILSPLDFKDQNMWNSTQASLPQTDAGGNTVTYIIERMCRDANRDLSRTDCLYNENQLNNCDTSTTAICPNPGTPAQLRVTIRSVGPSNAISYVQGFIF